VDAGVSWRCEPCRTRRHRSSFASFALVVVALVLDAFPAQGQEAGSSGVVIYDTGFEVSEGYDPEFTLAGQNGWTIYGTGGNGLITIPELFPDRGQQAYLGFHPPTAADDTINVWRPLGYAPIPADKALIAFTVLMTIVDSTTPKRDDFRWSVYNTNGFRFFSLDFDNEALQVSYALDDDAGFVSTGVTFTNEVVYELAVEMDFGRNTWSAWLDETLLAWQLPITTVGSALNLGDIDAVWAIHDPAAPGDNFMVFDDYRVAALPPDHPERPPIFETMVRLTSGRMLFGLYAESGQKYTLEATTDFAKWVALETEKAVDGWVEFTDSHAASYPLRFYRARRVP
jgi:hypothetical protein